MTAPLCPSRLYDLAVIACILAFALLAALAWIFQAYRRARIGALLLDECDDDYDAALNEVADIRKRNSRLDDVISAAMREMYANESRAGRSGDVA
jgi:uncharacterized membrane protein YccC